MKRIYIVDSHLESLPREEGGYLYARVQDKKDGSLDTSEYINLDKAWHDSEEEPDKNEPILVKRKDLLGDTYATSRNNGKWEVHRRINNIVRWAYINDLIPTE